MIFRCQRCQRTFEVKGTKADSDHVFCGRRCHRLASSSLPFTPKTVITDYLDGFTIREVAKRHGLTYYAVRIYLLAHRVTLRHRGSTPAHLLTPLPPEAIIAYRMGNSLDLLAKIFGYSRPKIKRLLVAQGVLIRGKGRPSGYEKLFLGQ